MSLYGCPYVIWPISFDNLASRKKQQKNNNVVFVKNLEMSCCNFAVNLLNSP